MADDISHLPPGDRPLECGDCKKPVEVCYTDATESPPQHTHMCGECPVLQKKLHGSPPSSLGAGPSPHTSLCCGTCGTTIEEVQTGAPIGCSACYEVFDEVFVQEMVKVGAISKRFKKGTRGQTIHVGKAPGQITTITPTAKVIALNQALDDTLKREDYEQAAALRDQIKALTEEDPNAKDE